MALFELTSTDQLEPIQQTTFRSLGKLERHHIQRALRAQIEAITPGVRTMVIAEEFSDWVGANRRIDLLCMDDQARLVVVELKREEGAHMELQALRYAAMISTMRWDQAVEAHRKYLASIGASEDAEGRMREFLQQESGPLALSETVRICLAAAEFSQEMTTTVLWLNRQGLDIRCVQMRPHILGERTLVDIQQVIPLPEAAQYQVAVREKAIEQAAARPQRRLETEYDLTVAGEVTAGLTPTRLVHALVAAALRFDVPLQEIQEMHDAQADSPLKVLPGRLSAAQFQAVAQVDAQDYLMADGELLYGAGSTIAVARHWGRAVMQAVAGLSAVFPASANVSYSVGGGVAQEVRFDGYTLRRLHSKTIEVLRPDGSTSSALPVLRMLAPKLGVSLLNGAGGVHNTRQLGEKVINAIAERSAAGAGGGA